MARRLALLVAVCAAALCAAPPARAGVVTEFPLPTLGSGPKDIAAAPDGAQQNGNRIGRITTAGSITEFTVPTARSGSRR